VANILLISAPEDAPRTQALAQRFKTTGFSVREGVSSDAALRSASAGVLLWSQESRQSPLFQDTARRVVSAGKAVVARLTDTLPAEGFGMLRAFDLSQWQGDPQDPLLDKLHDAVKQMVVRDLCGQAEHWRSISDRNDASAFSDYLTRYGPEGAFAALAQWRLHRLTAEPGAQPRVPSQTRALVASPAPRPAANRAMPPALPPPRAMPAPSPIGDARGLDGSGSRATQRRRNGVSRLRGAMIMTMTPFVVGVALGGAFSVPGLGGSTNVLGPAETLAAPIDAQTRPLGATAPSALAAVPEAWLSALTLLPDAESEQVAAASAERLPAPTTSPNGNDAPAGPTVLAVAPLISNEPVEGAAAVVAEAAPHNADLSASSPHDAIADDAVRGSALGQDVAALIQDSMTLINKVDGALTEFRRLEPR
jgi:hypothetical protein